MRNRIWGLIFTLCSMQGHAGIPAPGDSTGMLDLKTALQLCSENYPAIKARKALQKAAVYDIAAEKMNYLPQLIVQDQYLFASTNNVPGAAYSNNGTAISVTGGTRAEPVYQGVWTSFATMLVDWKFFNFGKVKAGIAVTESALQKTKAELDNEVFQQQVKVADAYLLLIALKQFMHTQEQNLERANAFRSAIMANTLNGLRPGADSSLANAEVAKAKLSLLQAEQDERTQQVRLAQLIGQSQPIQEIDTAGLTNGIPPTLPMQETLDTSKAPLLRYYRSLVDLQASRARAVKRSVFPSLSLLSAGWTRGSGIDNMNGHLNSNLWEGVRPRIWNYMAGVAFRWNILSVPQVRKQYHSALQQQSYNSYLLEEAVLKSNAELSSARLRLATALEQVKEAPLQYEAALQAYNQSDARYKSGLSTLPELYQALYTLNRAAADQLTAYNNVWRALLMEAGAAGDLSIFTSRIGN